MTTTVEPPKGWRSTVSNSIARKQRSRVLWCEQPSVGRLIGVDTTKVAVERHRLHYGTGLFGSSSCGEKIRPQRATHKTNAMPLQYLVVEDVDVCACCQTLQFLYRGLEAGAVKLMVARYVYDGFVSECQNPRDSLYRTSNVACENDHICVGAWR